MMPVISPFLEDGMSDEQALPPQLFVLRLWQVPLDNGRFEWRGRLQHAQTNEIRHFRDWPALIPSLLAMLRDVENPTSPLPMDIWSLPPIQNDGEAETI
jgi:hypothetical protein